MRNKIVQNVNKVCVSVFTSQALVNPVTVFSMFHAFINWLLLFSVVKLIGIDKSEALHHALIICVIAKNGLLGTMYILFRTLIKQIYLQQDNLYKSLYLHNIYSIFTWFELTMCNLHIILN